MDELTRVLYLSYDGMTDPLGQSQVIPYLIGLSNLGYRFTIISFEKKERYQNSKEEIGELLRQHNIEWVPLSYTKKPPVLSTLIDILRMKRKAFELNKTRKFRIVHCRSYISAMIGLDMKKKQGTKFLFDMRGFYADERVEGGIWDLKNPVFNEIYRYFKKREIEFFSEADHSVCLTENGRQEIHKWKSVAGQPVPIEVIPCCADLDKFSRENINPNDLKNLRNKLGIEVEDFVLSYLGSLGTWYMPEEMMDFFKVLVGKIPQAKFLFITGDSPEAVKKLARLKGIAESGVIVTAAPHKDVPLYLALSSWSIFFIKPVYSKKASSPTKQGEIMGMGIPHICNSGVGDVDFIVNSSQCGVLVNDFGEKSYAKAVLAMNEKVVDSWKIRSAADGFYSLKVGVNRYFQVYNKLMSS